MDASRYNRFAILLHWVMALAFIGMIVVGFIMSYAELDKPLKFQLYQWHKSAGVLLLIAFFVRIIWRQLSRLPTLPASISARERMLSKLGHFALYAAMIAMPLTGWLAVSTSVYGLPTIVFGWFEWPHIPGVEGNKLWHEIAEVAHLVIAVGFILLVFVHVAAVIKHARKDNINLLPRMGIGKVKL